jgi:serine/threonine-protein kinase RsbW
LLVVRWLRVFDVSLGYKQSAAQGWRMERVLVNIPSNPIFERVVRASADELGQAIGLPPERIEDLKLAVSEAVNNAIDHGNHREAAKLVEVTFVLDVDKLEVRIRDEGAGVGSVDFSPRIVEDAPRFWYVSDQRAGR